MDFIIYYIKFKNVETADIEIQLQDFETYEDPPSGTIVVDLDGAHTPVILDTVESDDEVTKVIKGKRLSCGFNSGESSENKDVETFSDGDDGRFLTRLQSEAAIPFIGNLVLDDNQEAFQPKPNPVQLRAGEGLGSLKDIKLRESDGDVPVGHYRIIDYIYLCLRNLAPSQDIHVAMNLFELDTDPDTSHAFFDTFLDARTFETDVNERDDCFTVLTKILDAFGCFICYDHDGWYIIRWTEYDDINDGSTILRFANFNSDGTFIGYDTRNVDKVIAHDADLLYEGYRLSNDNALKRFQRRAKSVTHTYKFEQPKEVPCNSAFLRGTVDDDVLPLKTYVPECWTLRNGVPGSYGTPTSEMRIGVRFDPNEYETERFLYLTPTATSQLFEYAESQAIDVHEKDKFEASVNWRTESLYPSAYGGLYSRMVVYLRGDDGSDWLLGNTTLADPDTPLKWWDTGNFTVNTSAGHIFIDSTLIEETEWQSQDIPETPEIPISGKLFIWLYQGNQSGATSDDDGAAIDYSDLRFKYIPYINGTYHNITAQENKVTGDNDSRKTIEHEMFIGDSPKKLFKGALKKFDGTNYVLTETWNYYNDTGVLANERMGKHNVFAWWNQYRKTRTVIETDIQGIRSTAVDGLGIPGLIHRWKILHGEQEDKYFMLTSFRGMDFYLCQWNGVFVEMSSGDGDKVYDDTWNFKFIQGE